MDVIIVSTTGDLGWLEAWKPVLSQCHFIVACSTSSSCANFPESIGTLTVINRDAASRSLGSLTPSLGPRDWALLHSQQDVVYLLGEGCTPSQDHDGLIIDPKMIHLKNIATPSTPLFFNTLYDPYRPGTDFVRGYPFSMREGQSTAISNGLILSKGGGQRLVDATLTVPRGVAVNMSFRNFAFDRTLIGVATYSGIKEDGSAAEDNTWASYCCKAICDHLKMGCKHGLPHITDKSSADIRLLNGSSTSEGPIKWEKEILSFFQKLKLSETSYAANVAYAELACQVKEQLGKVDPYFIRLADAMLEWLAMFNSKTA